ncbi:MAG TPA: tripartite tricarboxylate transporter substrate-binding protein [Alphaproteobacteria bacterium]|nr:tripartite tricarboxylate transporter substrate-binding protein [Alphaproteobacteria bacterium]
MRMQKMKFATVLSLAGLSALSLGAATEAAMAADGFYKGKTLRVIIRSSPGGGNDFYGRLMARHMPRYIPGNPNSIPINMKGAGGIVAANYMHNRAKRDGTEIAILSRAIAVVQRTKTKGVLYDVNNLIPLGSAASNTAVFVVAQSSKLMSLKDIKRGGREITVGTTGPGGGAYQRSMVMKLDGYPMKIITGYGSNAEKVLSVARGDVEMTAGSFETMRSAIKEENFRIIGKLGAPHPDVPKDTVDLRDVVSKARRPLAALLVAPLEAGRPFYTTPEVPADRVKILRAAFEAALKDPKLLEEARKAKRGIEPSSWKQMVETNKEILGASDEIMEQFKKLM